MNVEIISIGDEIMIGQIVNTNSAWMATELNRAGFTVQQIVEVHDSATQIVTALDNALSRAEIVLLTGGLGPTNDDITKKTLCDYFGTQLVYNQQVYDNIANIMRYRKRVMNALTDTQALVPENCTIVQNPVGTAPVMWFDHNGKTIVALPGVPFEMKHAMSNSIIPMLHKKYKFDTILHQTVVVHGIPESALAMQIADWENALPPFLHLAYLPTFGIVKLRLSGMADNIVDLQTAINQQIEKLKAILGNAIVAFFDLTAAQIVENFLNTTQSTLAVAESCTGGNIAHQLTEIQGISKYFKGGIVAYSNEAKENILAVDRNDIIKYGAVSRQVAKQMAIGARKIFGSNFAIATTGIAGPDGGSAHKPVGTVWIAVTNGKKTIVRLHNFGNERIQNIERATQSALLMLLELRTNK
ncbi:MAG: CinA family nicotinamide mononucleotide deamidase-related protein [Paludibacter sp.]|jgi:nicotinamide-nucleotide amidase|nr:CinA family nicotinamide mononucleotide deamidase-related protein [Paludibacter sp.]